MSLQRTTKNGELTPRERVKLALGHQEPDRVPVDFYATGECWARLITHLGLSSQESVLQYLGVDLRHPRLEYIGPPLRTFDDGSYIDPWGITWSPVPHEGGIYFEVSRHPLDTLTDASQIADYPWPSPDWWDVSPVVEEIAAWDKTVEYAIAIDDFGDPGGFYEIANYMRGMEQFLTDMALSPDIPFEIMRHIANVFVPLAEKVLTTVGDRVDLIWTSDDIAHQRGLMMSLPMWRELIYPHHERFNARVHDLGGRVMYHSCGAVMNAVPGLIDMGIDVLDVLQFSADNMTPENLKGSFGDRLSFHGGIDVQQLLPRASTTEVETAVKHIIEVMGQDGGYILSPSHAVQVDTPPANIVAVYQVAGSLLDQLPDSTQPYGRETHFGPVAPSQNLDN